jgi:solute carrier family 25 citrate transporter 1
MQTSTKRTSGYGGKRPTSVATNLIAGGGAGMIEALVCYPLDTIKVRMQLSGQTPALTAQRKGIARTAIDIVRTEALLGLYRGLGAVLTGIVPKMALRFTSYEFYRQLLANQNPTGKLTGSVNFLAGLAAGVTEAVAVVCPMEVVKIRLQAQRLSMSNPLDVPKYRNAAHALAVIIREEGFGALYCGITLTALRQGTNQAANFAAYTELKDYLQKHSAEPTQPLSSWKTSLIGLVSGAVGPFTNAPIDTIKTRLQRTPAQTGESTLGRTLAISRQMWRQEGLGAFWMGITPRVMRVAPGQAVTFTVYEYLRKRLETIGETLPL